MLGSPLALSLKKPFFMLRKSGKMPNAVESEPYTKEYKVIEKKKRKTGYCHCTTTMIGRYSDI